MVQLWLRVYNIKGMRNLKIFKTEKLMRASLLMKDVCSGTRWAQVIHIKS